jgi:hypothetical protein
MLVDIDSKNNNEFIIEELDEEHILVKETKINELKARLNQVGTTLHASSAALTVTDDEGTLEGTRELRFGVVVVRIAHLELSTTIYPTQFLVSNAFFASAVDRFTRRYVPASTSRSGHTLLLRGSLLSTDPLRSVGHEELGVGREVVEEAVVVQSSTLCIVSMA